MKILLHWFAYALAIFIAAMALPGIHINSFVAALVVAVVLGILNISLKPFLILLTLPVNILTLGIFTFFINALLILLTGRILEGFEVDGFGWAFLFGILLSLVRFILFRLIKNI